MLKQIDTSLHQVFAAPLWSPRVLWFQASFQKPAGHPTWAPSQLAFQIEHVRT